jgi:hypothetical protein
MDFQAVVDLTVDLDATDGAGVDLYPNATGILLVHAEGSVTGDEYLGEVTYAVTVTRQTDITITDPASGAQVTAAAGPGIDFALHVAWRKTDEKNWTLVAQFDASRTALPLTAVADGTTYTATVSAECHEKATLTVSAGVLSASYEISGYWEADFTDGAGDAHTVRIDVASLASITITIDGVVYGPYTAWQLASRLGVTVG